MAIGLGLFFGIMLPINFNSPYKSLNITEFWRRWHITLGRFLKDYLYIPLGGNRLGTILTLRNLFVVAFLSGIWHGAGFGFIVWGTLHGIAMCMHRIYSRWSKTWRESLGKVARRIYCVFCWILTFNFINITWIFFRSENLDGAINLLKGMLGIEWVELPQRLNLPKILESIGGRNDTLIYIILSFIVILSLNNSIQKLEAFKPNFWNPLATGFCFYLSLLMLFAVPYEEFIYFNF